MNATTLRTQAKFQNILFATDFSEAAARAIPYVRTIAEVFDAHVVALYVRPIVVGPTTPPGTWANEIRETDLIVLSADRRKGSQRHIWRVRQLTKLFHKLSARC